MGKGKGFDQFREGRGEPWPDYGAPSGIAPIVPLVAPSPPGPFSRPAVKKPRAAKKKPKAKRKAKPAAGEGGSHGEG